MTSRKVDVRTVVPHTGKEIICEVRRNPPPPPVVIEAAGKKYVERGDGLVTRVLQPLGEATVHGGVQLITQPDNAWSGLTPEVAYNLGYSSPKLDEGDQ